MKEHSDDWARVQSALASPDGDGDFRTVDGIARETSLRPADVKRVPSQHGDRVRQSLS